MKYKMKYILPVLLVVFAQFTIHAQTIKQSDTSSVKKPVQINGLYGMQDYNRFVGNSSVVKGEDLKSYPSMMVLEALEGRLPGFFLMQNNGNPGEDNFTGYVRGSVGGYVTLVDGVERPLNNYDIEQIEEIRLLKDPVSKALYGGRMTNGILMVTTKRGKMMKSEFHVGVQRGVKMPTVLPKYLNAYDFATNYNKALANDNITTGVYSQAALDAYQNHTNNYQYPDVDFYGQFLNSSMDLTRLNTEYYGGNDKTNFYVHGAYQKEGGFEAYGNKSRQMQTFNLQGNLDSKFSDAITLHTNFSAYKGSKQYPGALGSVILGTLSSRYPNAYPILVAPDSAGGTASFKDNPYAQQVQSGFTLENYLRMQTDLGFDVKLDKILKGLSFHPAYSFDIYHRQNLQKLNTVGIYSIASYGLDGRPATFTTLQTPVKATSQSLGTDNYTRTWAFTGSMAYQREFGKHAVDVDMVYFISKIVTGGSLQDYKRQNLGLRANYTYAGKYTVEGVLNYCGSQSFAPGKRFEYFPALGAGWLISEEKFLKNNKIFDFLKLNASWGIMGDGNIDINQWRESWGATATYGFNTSSTAVTTQLNQVSNPMLDWPKQRETDISLEAKMFKRIGWKFSYFDYLQYDWLSKGSNVTPAINGGVNFLPWSNFGKTGLTGVEAELSYGGRVGKVTYQVSTNFTYSKSKKVLIDELPDPNFKTQGTPWDAIWGYQAAGTYTQDEINQIIAGTSTLPLPSYMDPKALKAGNIKYADLNGDKVIDKYDTRIIGNNAPRIMYGANLKAGYKGFDLFVNLVGYGQYKRQLNSSYYQVFSTRKYSNVILTGLPNGNPYPLLTTGSGTNDFQTSNYWIVKGGYLKVQNVSLSYSLPKKLTDKMRMSDMKLFVYGTDLFTISKIKDSDPESITAGLADYPLFRTVAFGLNVTF